MRGISGLIGLAIVGVGVGGIHLYQQWRDTAASTSQQSERWVVISVTDGDTLTVGKQGREERIRLCGIDAPETAHSGKAGQPLGEESKAHLQQLVDEAGGNVAIVPIQRDRYGRQVAEVFMVPPGGQEKSVQEELLTAGMAYVYPQYIGDCPNGFVFEKAEAIGQKRKVGVWAGSYEKPWDYRRSQ